MRITCAVAVSGTSFIGLVLMFKSHYSSLCALLNAPLLNCKTKL